jgi:hypothetical protein
LIISATGGCVSLVSKRLMAHNGCGLPRVADDDLVHGHGHPVIDRLKTFPPGEPHLLGAIEPEFI